MDARIATIAALAVWIAPSGCGGEDFFGEAAPPASDNRGATPGAGAAFAWAPGRAEEGSDARDEAEEPDAESAGLDWAERARRTFVLQPALSGVLAFAAFSERGDRVAIASSTGTVAVVEVATGRTRAIERLVRGSDTGIWLSMRGSVVLAASELDADGAVLWNWRTGVRRRLEGALGWNAPIALSPRGDRYVVSAGGVTKVAAVRDGGIVVQVEGGAASLEWPIVGVILATGDVTGGSDLAALDPRTLAPLWSAPAQAWVVGGPRRDRVAIRRDGVLSIRELPSGRSIAEIDVGGVASQQLVWSREGDRVALAARERTVVLSISDGERIEVPGQVGFLSRREALTVQEDGSIRRFALDARRLGARVVEPPRAQRDEDGYRDRRSAFFGPNGEVVASLGRRVELVDAHGQHRPMPIGGEHGVSVARMAPDGSALVIGGRFGVQVWSAEGVRESSCRADTSIVELDWERGTIVAGDECWFARDTRRRLLGDTAPLGVAPGARGVVGEGVFVEPSTGRVTRYARFPHTECDPELGCDRVLFAPGGRAFALDVSDLRDEDERGIFVFDTTSDRVIARIGAYRRMAFAADGAWLAHAGPRSLRVIELGSPAHERALVGHPTGDDPEGPIGTVVAPSPDGRWIAWTPGDRHRVQIVGVESGEPRGTLDVGLPIVALRWSSDSYVLAVQTEHSVRIYAIASGELIESLENARGTLDVACAAGRLYVLRDHVEGGFEFVHGGACERREPLPAVSASRRHLVWIDQGIVRVRRLDDGAELVVRTLRDASSVRHLAHDAAGRYWTDPPPSPAESVPSWVLRGDGWGEEEEELRPLDPHMRRDDLLRTFFAPVR
jgi:hypothetical protein